MGGQIIDASVVSVPRQHNSRDENTTIKLVRHQTMGWPGPLKAARKLRMHGGPKNMARAIMVTKTTSTHAVINWCGVITRPQQRSMTARSLKQSLMGIIRLRAYGRTVLIVQQIQYVPPSSVGATGGIASISIPRGGLCLKRRFAGKPPRWGGGKRKRSVQKASQQSKIDCPWLKRVLLEVPLIILMVSRTSRIRPSVICVDLMGFQKGILAYF